MRIDDVIENLNELPESMENEMKNLNTEIEAKRFGIEEVTQILANVPEFIEL